jgi:hypothetical protein
VSARAVDHQVNPAIGGRLLERGIDVAFGGRPLGLGRPQEDSYFPECHCEATRDVRRREQKDCGDRRRAHCYRGFSLGSPDVHFVTLSPVCEPNAA